MGHKKIKRKKHLPIEQMYTFDVRENVKDKIELEAHKIGLKAQLFHPIRYEYQQLTLGLIEFYDEKAEFTFDDMILWKAKSFGCFSGSKLASFLIDNQDKIPNSWKAYKLFFPGTVWTSGERKNKKRFLTVIYYEDSEWKFSFEEISGFPSFPKSRFVTDCKNFISPRKIEMNQIVKSGSEAMRYDR